LVTALLRLFREKSKDFVSSTPSTPAAEEDWLLTIYRIDAKQHDTCLAFKAELNDAQVE
jgi:hypothetical protein